MKHRNKQGEVVESEILVDKKTGLYYRKDTSDRSMIKDSMKNYQSLDINGDDRVLDLGANIGAFCHYASQFVMYPFFNILAVEPDQYNCAMIRKNCGVDILQKVVVPDYYEADSIEFLINTGGNSACSGKANLPGTRKTKRHILEAHPVIRFSDLVEHFRPTILKIDIEGGEYGILDGRIPSCIRQIGGEIHLRAKGPDLMEKLRKEWDVIMEEDEYVFGNKKLINFVVKR